MRKFYGGRWKVGLDFEYLRVETGEGAKGVYHVLYFGDFIPQAWLSEQWEEINGAKVVDIRATRGRVKDAKRLSRYCIAQYCSGQSKYVRYSWSRGWVFKGFVGVWKGVIKLFGFKKGKKVWREMMSGVKRKYEDMGGAYRIGKDPPYVEGYDGVIRKWMPMMLKERGNGNLRF